MGSFNGFLKPKRDSGKLGSNIKSVQKGETQFTSDSTVVTLPTAINVNKSIVIITVSPAVTSTAQQPIHLLTKSVLSGTNTLTLSVGTYSATYAPYVSWEVIEFITVKSKQTGDITSVNGTTTATLPIPVSSRAVLVVSATGSNTGSNVVVNYPFNGIITDSTTVTFRAITSTINIHYEVIDFY